MIDDALEEVSLSYPHLRWRKEIRDPAAAVSLAPALLHEVLLNLARNAAEAMGGQGEALLSVRAGNSALQIEVRDGGHGMTPRVLRNLFKPGYTTTAGGSGFGLFLARRLVEAEGGELTVAPCREGGACFSIRLPTHVS